MVRQNEPASNIKFKRQRSARARVREHTLIRSHLKCVKGNVRSSGVNSVVGRIEKLPVLFLF